MYLPPKKEKEGREETVTMLGVLSSLIVVIISQRICTSKHHLVCPKYIILILMFKSYLSEARGREWKGSDSCWPGT